jgi:hypothetical protein
MGSSIAARDAVTDMEGILASIAADDWRTVRKNLRSIELRRLGIRTDTWLGQVERLMELHEAVVDVFDTARARRPIQQRTIDEAKRLVRNAERTLHEPTLQVHLAQTLVLWHAIQLPE